MRTTLDIDEDILLAAKEQAAREKISIGKAPVSYKHLTLPTSDLV